MSLSIGHKGIKRSHYDVGGFSSFIQKRKHKDFFLFRTNGLIYAIQ